ncbi:MAG: hypothetical protein KC535_05285 [Nanoarchaeota archaeon]|nr:hypothetical protein [Nanoarchaeota archaeon]
MISVPLAITEMVYSLIIILLCLVIYKKTQEIYGLTKYKGIYYFRNAFLFFALAYFFRFLFLMFRFSWSTFDVRMLQGFMWPLNLVVMGYFGTLAILSLTLSTVWKRLKNPYLSAWMHLVSLVVALLALITLSTQVLLFAHGALIVVTLVLVHRARDRKRKFSNVFLIYLLLFVFWLINLLVLSPRSILFIETKLVVYLLSIILFVVVVQRVRKWLR